MDDDDDDEGLQTRRSKLQWQTLPRKVLDETKLDQDQARLLEITRLRLERQSQLWQHLMTNVKGKTVDPRVQRRVLHLLVLLLIMLMGEPCCYRA